MAAKRLRVFIDTSALVAGIVSATGAAREVFNVVTPGEFLEAFRRSLPES